MHIPDGEKLTMAQGTETSGFPRMVAVPGSRESIRDSSRCCMTLFSGGELLHHVRFAGLLPGTRSQRTEARLGRRQAGQHPSVLLAADANHFRLVLQGALTEDGVRRQLQLDHEYLSDSRHGCFLLAAAPLDQEAGAADVLDALPGAAPLI